MEPTERQLLEYLGPLELQIMRTVWADGPSTVNDVLAQLNDREGRDLVYNTVMSTLGRLFDKGYLTRERQGRAYVYAGTSPADFMQSRIAESVSSALSDFGGIAVAGLAQALDDSSRAQLLAMLDGDED